MTEQSAGLCFSVVGVGPRLSSLLVCVLVL